MIVGNLLQLCLLPLNWLVSNQLYVNVTLSCLGLIFLICLMNLFFKVL